MTPRILVTVSRSWTEWSTMRTTLRQVFDRYPGAVLVHGDAPRGDRDAAAYWRGMGGEVEPIPADWSECAPRDERAEVLYREHGIPPCSPKHRKVSEWHGEYCPTAGLRRDVAMVETGPDRCLALLDPKSKTKGAYRTAQMCEDAGIRTERYEQGQADG